MLSIDGTFLIMLASFVVFMVLMRQLYFAPLLTIQNTRQDTLDAGKQTSEEAAQKSLALAEQVRQHMQDAHRQAQQVIQAHRDQVRGQAADRIHRAREEAQQVSAAHAQQRQADQVRVYDALQPDQPLLAKLIVDKLAERQPSIAGDPHR